MQILVIGGTGITGPHVVRRLVEMGHEVTIFHRGQHEADLPPEVRHIHQSSFNPEDRWRFAEFADEFRRLAPEVVVHMIASTEQDGRSLVQAFRGIARCTVVPSSIDVYRTFGRLHGTEPGPPDAVPLTEDAPLREKPPPFVDERYEKRWVEREVMGDPDLPGTILRLPAIYGPRDYQYRLFEYLKRMDEGRPAILMDEGRAQWRFSRGYAENVAAAIVRAVVDDRATGRIYNVAEPEALPEAEWVRRIGQAARWDGEVVVMPKDRMPAHLIGTEDFDQHWVVDTLRIRVELGCHELVSRDEALHRTIEWERAHPPAKVDPKAFDYAAEDAVLAEWCRS
jgi:nucleoside-diphosphate-sugar epimerase